MSLSDEEILRLNRVLHDLEEGNLSPEEVQKLEEWLSDSENARRYYVQRGILVAGLMRVADEIQTDEEASVIIKDRKNNYWLIVSVLSCLIMLFSLLPWSRERGAQNVVVEEKLGPLDAGCAVLVEVVDAVWDEDGGKMVGMSIPAGKLELKSGLARLEFYSGASMTLEGPCMVELMGVDEAKCMHGRLQVRVSPHARGFKLLAPDAKLVDLGTEFGVVVDQSGRSEVHVFEGEVDVYPGRQGENQKVSLTTGKMWSVTTGKVEKGARRADFINGHELRSRSKELSEQRVRMWRENMKQLMLDERLVVGYSFETESEIDRILENGVSGANEGTHGSIVGARWSQGRWPGKNALQFKSPGDRVRVKVDGEYTAITLCAWVAVDGYDRRFNSLFLTDGFQVGNPHWQIQSDGRLVMGVKSKSEDKFQHVFRSPPVFQPGNLGIWYHVAVTFDLRSGIGRHFVNGRMVMEHEEKEIPEGSVMRFGMAELGNWGQPSREEMSMEVRSFNGRMDEFLLFREALNGEEIRKIYEMGRPE